MEAVRVKIFSVQYWSFVNMCLFALHGVLHVGFLTDNIKWSRNKFSANAGFCNWREVEKGWVETERNILEAKKASLHPFTGGKNNFAEKFYTKLKSESQTENLFY